MCTRPPRTSPSCRVSSNAREASSTHAESLPNTGVKRRWRSRPFRTAWAPLSIEAFLRVLRNMSPTGIDRSRAMKARQNRPAPTLGTEQANFLDSARAVAIDVIVEALADAHRIKRLRDDDAEQAPVLLVSTKLKVSSMSSQLLNPNREALPLGSIDAGAERRSISGGRPTDEERRSEERRV